MRVGILVIVASVASCSDGATSTPDAAPHRIVTEDKQLVAGEIVEAILDGGAGDLARLSLTAPTAKLDWNIHGHTDGRTQTIAEELQVMSVDYTFAPTARADWYLLLRNRDTSPMTVQVTIELFGDMQWSGWQ